LFRRLSDAVIGFPTQAREVISVLLTPVFPCLIFNMDCRIGCLGVWYLGHIAITISRVTSAPTPNKPSGNTNRKTKLWGALI
jgi:hypothetical protein